MNAFPADPGSTSSAAPPPLATVSDITPTLDPIGQRRWAIAEGYIPPDGPQVDDPRLISHETACLLNANGADAHITLIVYFSDRDPVGPYHITVPARRTLHMRFNDLTDPAPVPRDTEYSSVFESDLPIVVQHTRLDSRPNVPALLSTIAYSGG